MPKVVRGDNFDKFVQTGEHQTIDAQSKKPVAAVPEKTPEAKEAIAKAEAETAETMEPKEDTGLEAGDEDLAERAQQRIAKKHREMKQADALAKKLRLELDDTEIFSKAQYNRAVAAEEEANRLRTELAQVKQPVKSPGPNVAPDANDPIYRDEKGEFQLKKYEEARDKYLLTKFREEQAAERATADQAQKVKAFEAKLERAREKYPDFKEVVGAADVSVPPYIQQYMVESDFGADLGYFFAKNPGEFERISLLSPIKAIAAIGKLESQWEVKEVKEPAKEQKTLAEILPPKTLSAPAPVIPLSGAGSPGVNSDPAKMSPKELLAYTREKELARKKRG
jgi:hypothetical protein